MKVQKPKKDRSTKGEYQGITSIHTVFLSQGT
jgi:hypothetical protein